ncbi:MAG: tetratricopeptide repeat protein, partial [Gammaproteobacteria bacterium]|nr:tetratricopeptide repeat protein [Gammaproteobacteria bacterium]
MAIKQLNVNINITKYYIESPLKAIQSKIQQAQFSAAISDCQQQLTQSPDDKTQTQLLYLLAVAYRYNKNQQQALEAIQRLQKIAPEHGRACQEKGHIYLAMGQQDDAKKAFNRAVKINPALIASWQSLQKIFKAEDQQDSLQKVQAQLQQLQRLPAELLAVTEMLHDGAFLKAEQLCRHYLQNNKHNIEAMRLLAEIGIQLKIYDDAEFLLESCVELAPNNPLARTQYLNLLIKLGKYHKAHEQVNYLLKKEPDNFSYQLALGSVLTGLGQIEQGVALFNKAIAKEPDSPGVHLQLGHALKTKGDIENAVKSYQKAYQLKQGYGDAYWSLANSKTYHFTNQEIADILKFLTNDNLSDTDKCHLYFSIGKAYEDREQYDDAFKYYLKGNEIKHRQTGYNAEFTEFQVEQQIKYCTPELFHRRRYLGFKQPDPVFIVGLPRAGSTLLEQILASHSQVDGTMELHNILGLAMRLRGRVATSKVGEEANYPRNLAEIDEKYFSKFGEQFINDTRVYREQAPFFIDKMPNNFLHIGLIKLILPNAKIIDARRSPMACCFSCFKQLFGEGQDFTYGLEEIGRYYNSYLKLMEHWDKVLPGFILRVRHEDVVDDLEKQVRRILDFCGLEFEQSCLEFYRTKRNIKTPSSEQVRQPIYKSAT